MSENKNVAVYIRQTIDTEDDFHIAMKNAEHLKKTAEGMGRVVETYIDDRRKAARPSWDILMNDCRAGKIDIIVTRSVSRLGRKLEDILTILRELDSLGVAVYFEMEGLCSGSDNFGQIISTLYAMIEAESTEPRGGCVI